MLLAWPRLPNKLSTQVSSFYYFVYGVYIVDELYMLIFILPIVSSFIMFWFIMIQTITSNEFVELILAYAFSHVVCPN